MKAPRLRQRRTQSDVLRVLHKLWTAAVGTEGYDKADWRELEAWIKARDRRRQLDRRRS